MFEDLKIVIPVAGVGTRLRPHTLATPKPLLPVAGKTILGHILDPLANLNPGEVAFVVGYLGDQIVEYVEKNYRFKATFIEQKELHGLGFAINIALNQLSDGPTLVILGDTITRTSYTEFINTGNNVIGLKKVEDPRRFGIAVIEDDRIVTFEEKPREPRSDLAIIGLYYFENSAVLKKHIGKVIDMDKRTRGEIQLTDALEFMVRDGNIFRPYQVNEWYDCGKKETMLETNQALLAGREDTADYPDSEIIPPVAIDPSAEITDSKIGPNVSISANVKISHSIIKDSIIGQNAFIIESTLTDSIIGGHASIKRQSSRLNVGDYSELDGQH